MSYVLKTRAPKTSRILLPVVLAGGLLGGCQALGGGGGVMPVSEVGPPPSMRSAMPDRTGKAASVDPDGVPLQTQPTRPIALPKTAAGASGRTAVQERRIRREDIDVTDEGASGSGGGLSPQLGASGGMGVGGKF